MYPSTNENKQWTKFSSFYNNQLTVLEQGDWRDIECQSYNVYNGGYTMASLLFIFLFLLLLLYTSLQKRFSSLV